MLERINVGILVVVVVVVVGWFTPLVTVAYQWLVVLFIYQRTHFYPRCLAACYDNIYPDRIWIDAVT